MANALCVYIPESCRSNNGKHCDEAKFFLSFYAYLFSLERERECVCFGILYRTLGFTDNTENSLNYFAVVVMVPILNLTWNKQSTGN
jgi:hypothetical protein